MPRASVVITFHQQPADLRRCLHALAREGLDDVEVVLVDNGSRDPRTPALLEAWADRATVLRNPVDAGRVAARNQGARAARSPVVVWVDPRAEVRPGWLAPLASAAAAPGAGVAGAVLLGADGRVRHAGMAMVGRGRVVDLHRGVPGDHPVVRSRPLRLVSGALMAVARDVLLDVGALDLTFAGGVAEADLCMRMWDAGRENALAAGSVAVLHGEDPVPEPGDEKAFRRRWHAAPPDRDGLLAEDGVADPGWADCVWEGPLLDDSPEAAAGRDAVRALAAAGRRPLAREPEGTPLAPDAAGWCDEAILTALNRHRLGAPGAETLRGAVPAAALRPAGREGIGWLGPLLGRSGYAAAGRGIVQAASRAGLPVLALVNDALPDGMAPPELPLPPAGLRPRRGGGPRAAGHAERLPLLRPRHRRAGPADRGRHLLRDRAHAAVVGGAVQPGPRGLGAERLQRPHLRRRRRRPRAHPRGAVPGRHRPPASRRARARSRCPGHVPVDLRVDVAQGLGRAPPRVGRGVRVR